MPYTFTPQASDADGNRLTFSIVNKPKWMWFDSRTGRLRGKPKWAQRNRTFSDIVIRVSDGQSVRALPAFSIKVSATSNVDGGGGGGGGGGTDNRAPTISGIPAAKTKVGQAFVFRPQSADANGDKLTFTILNKPEWAQFSVIDGVLSGTPRTSDVRSYGNIVIRVSDGKATTALKPFAVTVVAADSATRSVTLNWSAPTRNTDGSALTDLSGYRVSYGTDSREYSSSVAVPGVAANSVELEGLTAGTWYFAIKSINRAGVESDFSGEVRAKL